MSGEHGEPFPHAEDRTIIGDDERILLFSCERFVMDIVDGDCCFMCGAAPDTKIFNDEHINPRWVLRRFGLFAKTIKLPNGERRQYDRYKVTASSDHDAPLRRRSVGDVR